MAFVRRRRLALMALLAAFLAALLASGCVMLEAKERELTWRPNRGIASWYGGLPADAQELYLKVPGGEHEARIHAWWWPVARADAPAILYLHGARWNLTGQLRRIEQLREFGFSVLAIDYRGFGQSDGEVPSETSAYEDAASAWTWLREHQGAGTRRFIYGHSLGGAVAVDLAARLSERGDDAAGLIIESSFTTLADAAAELTYRWLPVSWILAEKFDAVGKMANVRMPVLVVHGGSDRYLPARFSEALYAAAPGRKKLLLIPSGSHNNSMWIGNVAYREALSELFEVAPTAAGAGTAPGLGARRSGRRSG